MKNRKITNIFSANPKTENTNFIIQRNEVMMVKKLSYKKRSGYKRKPWKNQKENE